MNTTLKLLKKANACTDRYRHLCKSLGGAKKYGYDTPIRFDDLLDMNGLDDTLWALRAVPKEQEAERDFIARLFACACAERVRLCIEASRKFAHGEITDTELDAAAAYAAAARAAARADARAAAAAARAAALDAAAADDAALDAAAADDAALDAWDAEQDWQKEFFLQLLAEHEGQPVPERKGK